ncbi:MAG: hypothetical protein HC828_01725 [Blastochloris sp.]|nr:hypothetical protein [Blastochloris sp.]
MLTDEKIHALIALFGRDHATLFFERYADPPVRAAWKAYAARQTDTMTTKAGPKDRPP